MFAPKAQAPSVSFMTAARRLGGMVFTLKTRDARISVTATARTLSGIALVTAVTLAGGACAGFSPRAASPAPEYPERTLTAAEIARVDVRR